MNTLKKLLAKLGIQEEFEKGLLARILIILCLVLVIFGIVMVAYRLFVTFHPAFPAAHWTDILIESLVLVVGLAAFYCIRTARMRAATRLVMVGILIAVTLQTYFLGGPANDISGAMGMMFVVVLAVLMLDRLDRWIALGLVAAIFVGMNIAAAAGLIFPIIHLSPVEQTLFASFIWLSISVIVGFVLAASMGAIRREPYLLERQFEEAYPGEKVPFLSAHDQLTGLYNRLFFETEFDRLERSRAFPITVLSAEITGLKAVNDARGSKAGDEVIIDVAHLFRKVFRPEDIICRYGGDQFAVLLPSVDTDTAKVILGRIDSHLAEYNRAHHGQPVSLAIGVSTAEQGSSLRQHMKDAEKEMRG